jgi:phosphoribosylformylglycinamidine synthase
VYLDPRRGAMLAVAEAARNVACAGAVPIGATNCLNFGNPERPEIMWQLVEAIEGIAVACRALSIPITGGNVSLYNATDGEAIYPTPTIGVVGLIEDANRTVSRTFKGEGDAIVLLGEGFGEIGGSEYLKVIHGLVRGAPPALDLDRERPRVERLAATAAAGLVRSAHDCSDGGLAITLAECSFETGGIGLDVDIPPVPGAEQQGPAGIAAALFGESASRAVVSVPADMREALLRQAATHQVPARVIGKTGGSRLRISVAGAPAIDCRLEEAEEAWSTAIGGQLSGRSRGSVQ